MVRADKFRYPLVYGRGNFGYDNNPPAAYKYTKVKLSPYGLSMLEELAYDTVDLKNNYDDSKGKEEPVTLPVVVPNLLLNGCIGIAVGMTTSIPPHHLGETLTATINLVNNPDLVPIQKLQKELYVNSKNQIEILRLSTSPITHEALVDQVNDVHGAGTITSLSEAGWHDYIEGAGYSTEELTKREGRLIEALEKIREVEKSEIQPLTATDSTAKKLIEEQLNALTEERKRIEENFLQLKKKVNQELVNDLQGPDFPTGGYILEKEKLPSIYEKGEGTIYLRAKAQIFSPAEVKIVTELPYNVSKSALVTKIAEIIRDKEKRIPGLKKVFDYSSRGVIDVRIEFDAQQYDGQVILNKLYKNTPLQISFSVKMRATLENRPKENEKKLFDLETRRFIIEHDREISEIVHRDISDEECNQALKKQFSVEIKALQIRLQNTQDILLLDSSKEPSDLEQKVVDRILDTRRASFRQLRPGKQANLANEIGEIKTENEGLMQLVISKEKRKEKLIADLEQLKKDYEKDTRRTQIISDSHLIDERKAIAPEEIIIILSQGEKKKTKTETGESKPASYLNIYKANALDATNIPSVGKELKTRGENLTIININLKESGMLRLDPTEIVEQIVSVREDFLTEENRKEKYLVIGTKKGKAKRLPLEKIGKVMRGGKKIINIFKNRDEISQIAFTAGNDNIMVFTKQGKTKTFAEEKMRVVGRAAYGDTAIKLESGEQKKRCSKHQTLLEQHKNATCCDKGQLGAVLRCPRGKEINQEIRNCSDCNKIVPAAVGQIKDEMVSLLVVEEDFPKDEFSLLAIREDKTGIKKSLSSIFQLAKKRGGRGKRKFRVEEKEISKYFRFEQKKSEELKGILGSAQKEQVNPEVIKKYEEELTQQLQVTKPNSKKLEKLREEFKELNKQSLKNRVECSKFQAINQMIRECLECGKQKAKKAVKIIPTHLQKVFLIDKRVKTEIYLLAEEAIC
ncbi:2070_t:CDS:2 [Funneliformis geosporum]|nr:2070_t:CDS:2 [Funneliformis geosporum]